MPVGCASCIGFWPALCAGGVSGGIILGMWGLSLPLALFGAYCGGGNTCRPLTNRPGLCTEKLVEEEEEEEEEGKKSPHF